MGIRKEEQQQNYPARAPSDGLGCYSEGILLVHPDNFNGKKRSLLTFPLTIFS